MASIAALMTTPFGTLEAKLNAKSYAAEIDAR
jgi:hypothetical protein